MARTLKELYLAQVIMLDGKCWGWSGRKLTKGYGYFWYNYKTQLAHRVSYELFIGAIPDGLCVLHHCDNPSCSNPAHLFIGTKADNNYDMKGKGHVVFGEKHGRAKLTEKNIAGIKELRKSGKTLLYIARIYGVSFQQISDIVNGKSWKHLTQQLEMK